MLELLDLAPGLNVLEIGAGTGYNAALMAELVGDQHLVVTLDVLEDVVEQTRRLLARAGYPEIAVLWRDGVQGAAERAPFDRIVATVGRSDLSPRWAEQLATWPAADQQDRPRRMSDHHMMGHGHAACAATDILSDALHPSLESAARMSVGTQLVVLDLAPCRSTPMACGPRGVKVVDLLSPGSGGKDAKLTQDRGEVEPHALADQPVLLELI